MWHQPPVLPRVAKHATTGLHSVAAAQLQCGVPGSADAGLPASPCVAVLDARNWLDGEGPGRCMLVPPTQRGARMQVQQWAADGTVNFPLFDGGDAQHAERVLRTTYQQVGGVDCSGDRLVVQ